MSASTSMFLLNPDLETRFFGFIYFVGAGLILPLYFILIKAIFIKDHESPNMAYKMMNIINITQMAQSIAHFISAPALIFPNILVQFESTINVIGCIMNTFWIADFPMISLLAVSRILIFTNRIKARKFPVYMKLFIFFSWTWIAFVMIYESINQNLILVIPAWDYDFSIPYTEFFADAEIVLSLLCLGVSYFSYILMALLIYKKKSLKSSVNSRRNEMLILIQSTFVATYIGGIIFTWHQALFSMLKFIDMENETNQGILNCCMIFHCYVNPIMTLICNKSVRQLCFDSFRVRRESVSNVKSDLTPKRISLNQTATNSTFFVS